MERPELAALFTRQFNVADTAQMVRLGISPREIGRASLSGVIETVLPGVYCPAGSAATFEMRAMAALLHCGERSFLDGVTAAVLYGLAGMPRSPVVVTIADRARVHVPRWVEVARTRWVDEGDIVERADGLRCAHPRRMLLALAETFDDHRFGFAAGDAWSLGLLTAEEVACYVARRQPGSPGVARVQRWLARIESRRTA